VRISAEKIRILLDKVQDKEDSFLMDVISKIEESKRADYTIFNKLLSFRLFPD